jgi:hypothetical protein
MTGFEKCWGIYTGEGLAQKHLPTCIDGKGCSETSEYKIQTRNYPEESIRHSEHGKFEIQNILYNLRKLNKLTLNTN